MAGERAEARLRKALQVIPWLLLAPMAGAEIAPDAYTGQTVARGVAPDQTFQFSGIDSVNVFNGNLMLSIPIGPSYPVNGRLSYQLRLTYNSHLWDHDQVCTADQGIHECFATATLAAGVANAGAGWTLGNGRFFRPWDGQEDLAAERRLNPQNGWVYQDETGSRHELFATLHNGDDDESGDSLDSPQGLPPGFGQYVVYSRDGSYIRAVRSNPTAWVDVELPDGTIKRFEEVSAELVEWRLAHIRDRFGNQVDFTYFGDRWVISDPHGRLQTVFFEGTDSADFPRVVDRVELEAFGSQPHAVWDFTYFSQFELVKACPHSLDSAPLHADRVPFLQGIELPDSSTFFFQYILPDPELENCAFQSGQLRHYRNPVFGEVDFTFGPYEFPHRWPQDFGPNPESYEFKDTVFGVFSRTESDFTGRSHTWTYQPVTPVAFGHTGPERTWAKEMHNTVTDPLGNQTVHYFSVSKDLDDWGPGAYSALEYGLPYSRLQDTSGGLFLSQQVRNAEGLLLRETYVGYEADEYSDPVNGHKPLNQRLRKKKIVYLDDGERYAETTFSDFDGLGNHRTATTGGNFGSGNVRVETTRYNPGRGVYSIVEGTTQLDPDSSFLIPAASDPWVLGTFDRSEVSEGGATAVQTFCFDSLTGFLERQRTLRGVEEGSDDLIVEYLPGDPPNPPEAFQTAGNVERERYFGGDLQSVAASSDLCGLPLPDPGYELDHTYQFGALASSRYLDEPDDQGNERWMPFFSVDRDIDPRTGLVATSRDVSGVATDYEYDALGRVTFLNPDGGEGAWTKYTYRDTNTSAAPEPQVWIEVRPQPFPTSSSGLIRKELYYDGQGRLISEENGVGGQRAIEHDAAGRVQRQSEWVNSVGNPQLTWTDYEYDPFGRPTRVSPPDGPQHAVTFDYEGVSTIRRSTSIAQGSGETVVTFEEEYDRQGRLNRVNEPIHGAAGTSTEYGYDVAGRLSSVRTTSPLDGVVQQRLFAYDNRGFLQSERHPEKGDPGNGLVQYLQYDARGNLRQMQDGTSRLTYIHDRAERLVEIRESDPPGRALVTFEYGAEADRSLGKLVGATRLNDLPEIVNDPPLSLDDIEIGEVYEYDGLGGRLSRKVTLRDGVPWFEQSFGWSQLGHIEVLGYPECAHEDCSAAGEPTRNLEHRYEQGLLTELCDEDEDMPQVCGPGANAWLDRAEYWPSGMVDEIDHAGTFTEYWELASDLMARPARIYAASLPLDSGGTPEFDTGVIQYDGAGNIEAMGEQNFTYDGASRLVSETSAQGESQENVYDPFGNRVAVTTEGLTRPIATHPATNRLLGSPERPVGYDSAGNLTDWGAFSYSYDSFHQLVHQVGSASGTGVEKIFLYGPGDERLATVEAASGVTRWTLRDPGDRVIRTFSEHPINGWSWKKDYIYQNGRLLASRTPSEELHYFLDHLGTVRLMTRVAPGANEVENRHDYFGFGEETPWPDYDSERLRFTGHERDEYGFDVAACALDDMIENKIYSGTEIESACGTLVATGVDIEPGADVTFRAGEGLVLQDFEVKQGATFRAEIDSELGTGVLTDLDYMHARYYSPWMGRFLSVDPVSGTPEEPQSWNRYAYVQNQPVNFVDPNGEYRRDFHLDLTRTLAVAAGYSAAEAASVANATQGIDSGPTGPFSSPLARATFHFTGSRTRGALLSAAKASDSTFFKGAYLHALQDSFSHKGFGPLLGHVDFASLASFARRGEVLGVRETVLKDISIDRTAFRPRLALEAARSTFSALVELNGGSSPLSFEQIEGLVLEYLERDEDDGTRGDILKQIEGLATQD